MIQFILNDLNVNTALSPGTTLLDLIRYNKHLFGTKIGCREGDCGACTVLIGELKDENIEYRSMTSCLMPLGNVQGKHVVTIEGINFPGLNPVQQAMCDEGATQCGFCTPGFVVSLAGFCLQKKYDDPLTSLDGNICRCTGYRSIERAAKRISDLIKERGNTDAIEFAVKNKIVPEYFSSMKERLISLSKDVKNEISNSISATFIGGGTDLYVQKHEEMVHSEICFLSNDPLLKVIRHEDENCVLGSSVTVTDLIESSLIRKIFPEFLKYSKLVSSTQIRNMATIGGNFVNASPIGDLTVFFLALDAHVRLDNGKIQREVPLRDFYIGYKKIDKRDDEIIREVFFKVPSERTLFNFEKVSKRTHLDIASVNSAITLTFEKNHFVSGMISAGGVGPVPIFLKKASEFLSGMILSEENIDKVCLIAGEEISPISDARGTATYKRFLLQQLIRAHFITLFPSIRPEKLQSAYEEY